MFKLGEHYYVASKDEALLKLSTCGGAVPAIIKYLLSKGEVDLALCVRSRDILRGEPAFLKDPSDVYGVAGSVSIAPINLAKILRDYVGPDVRVAMTLKPCEAKAIKYLVSRGHVKRENLFLIGLNCGGLFDPVSLRSALVEHRVSPEDIVGVRYEERGSVIILKNGKEVRIDFAGEEAARAGYREACRRCLSPVPEDVDIACGYWGVLPRFSKHTYVIPMSERGVEVLERMLKEGEIEAVEVPEEGVKLRERIVDTVLKLARSFRAKAARELESEGLDEVLSRCVQCLECWSACPIRSEDEVLVWRRKVTPLLWQVSVIAYMYDKCVECGSCEDVCPLMIPFTLIIQCIRDLREELGVR